MTVETRNQARELAGWMVYDWANSAFSTTVAGALLLPYITSLAQAAVGDNGVVLDLGFLGAMTAKSFFPTCISISVLLQVFVLPVLGAIADYSRRKKHLMALFCYAGVGATCALFFVNGDHYLMGGALFIVANLGFGASWVLCNSYLPDICTPERRDQVSSRGFALGYLGGGLLLALNFILLQSAGRLGITPGLAVRISLLSAGVWWGVFAVVTFRRLVARPARRVKPPGRSVLTIGFTETAATFRTLLGLPYTLKYLVAYLFYNDGIQTVLFVASGFLSQELFTPAQRAAGEDTVFVLEIFLMSQFVGLAGALLFERIAGLLGSKRAILLSLIGWCTVVVYAYAVLRTTSQAWGMGVVMALVLGGSQALSRALFSRMIPRGFEASFFSLYEISERGTSWMGPMLFAVVVARTGSYRTAILSLIALFVVGTVLLAFTNTDRAIREAN